EIDAVRPDSMSSIVLPRRIQALPRTIHWMPLAALVVGAAWATHSSAPWVRMWCVAIACFAGLKWLTFSAAREEVSPSWGRTISYLLLWPGLDATAFLNRRAPARPALRDLCGGALETGCGLVFIYGVA